MDAIIRNGDSFVGYCDHCRRVVPLVNGVLPPTHTSRDCAVVKREAS